MKEKEEDLTFYKVFPKTCEPKDFWGQVKRTVNGNPISEEQVEMIVQAVCDGLDLDCIDQLLDLCCGNGALTERLFRRCSGGLGVDFSEYLIEVARKNFLQPPNREFILENVNSFVQDYSQSERFTKVLCYGSFQYLPKNRTQDLLTNLRKRFLGVKRVFIGNIPDRECVREFFGDNYEAGIEDLAGSSLGVWWNTEGFKLLAQGAGWDVEIRRMPKEYFTAHYRFDAVLSPSLKAHNV